jgi:CDP-diacylglycerol--glycerol-3-phosphate 3-phosphatidyltransferase
LTTSNQTRDRVKGAFVPVALALGRLGLTPNHMTLIGFTGTCVAAILAAGQIWLLAGILVIAFGIFDLFDGALARSTGQTSRFGAFLDSTLDRTGENLVYAGVAVGSATVGYVPGVMTAVLAMAFASGVTYARAKAEVIGLHGEVGVAPREVRLALLGIALIVVGYQGGVGQGIDGNPWGDLVLVASLGLIAALSGITILQRILHVRAQANREATSRPTEQEHT